MMKEKLRSPTEKPPVIILGKYITALGTLRSLAEHGVHCYCVSTAENYVVRSRHYRCLPGQRLDDPARLRPFLESLSLPRAVIMTCQDHWVRAVARLELGSSGSFLWSGPSPETAETFLDKSRLLEALERFSIPRPLTLRVREAVDLAPIGRADGRVWFLKPNDSQAFRKQFNRKAMRVSSTAGAEERLREIHGAGLEVVLQEYVPGGADCHYFVDGFVDRNGIVRALFARRRMRMWPPDFGDSSFMRSVPVEEVSPAAESVTRLLAGVGHRGIFSAEFKRDPRDGAFRLIEVNVRPWACVEFATSCGVNTPWMAYRDARGETLDSVRGYATGKRGGVFAKDYRSFMALRRKGNAPGWTRWVASWIGARDLMFRWDDPLPGIVQILHKRGHRQV